MGIRRFSLCLAFLLVAAFSQCSEARHSMVRRNTQMENYDDPFLSDGAVDTEQNDADAAAEDEEAGGGNATILTLPATYNLTIGRNVRLECLVSAEGSVVDWTHDGKNLVVAGFLVADRNKYSLEKANPNLIINALELADSGIYRCTVNQQHPVHIEHSLVVSESPKVVNISATDNGRPTEGSDLFLTCNVSGFPTPEIIWSVEDKNGNRKLTEADGEFTRNTVFIKKVKREHSGKYYCYALNRMGGDQKGIVIVVLGQPRIHVHKTVINSAINVEATLQCSVHEEEPVTINWFKDHNLITSNEKQIISTRGTHSNLTVIPEKDEDFGTYTCHAECAVGKHSRSIELVQLPVLEGLEAEGSKLAWRLHSHQALERIEVQLKELTGSDWKILEVPLPETRTHEYDMSYMIDDSQLNSGKYEAVVKVKNTKGWSESTASAFIDIVQQQQLRTAGVGGFLGDDSTINRPSSVLLSTILMYLLVRMF